MLCEFTVYDDDNFDPDDEYESSDDANFAEKLGGRSHTPVFSKKMKTIWRTMFSSLIKSLYLAARVRSHGRASKNSGISNQVVPSPLVIGQSCPLSCRCP